MTPQLWIWIGCGVFVLTMLALDLGVLPRRAREVPADGALAEELRFLRNCERKRREHDDDVRGTSIDSQEIKNSKWKLFLLAPSLRHNGQPKYQRGQSDC